MLENEKYGNQRGNSVREKHSTLIPMLKESYYLYSIDYFFKLVWYSVTMDTAYIRYLFYCYEIKKLVQ